MPNDSGMCRSSCSPSRGVPPPWCTPRRDLVAGLERAGRIWTPTFDQLASWSWARAELVLWSCGLLPKRPSQRSACTCTDVHELHGDGALDRARFPFETSRPGVYLALLDGTDARSSS